MYPSAYRGSVLSHTLHSRVELDLSALLALSLEWSCTSVHLMAGRPHVAPCLQTLTLNLTLTLTLTLTLNLNPDSNSNPNLHTAPTCVPRLRQNT